MVTSSQTPNHPFLARAALGHLVTIPALQTQPQIPDPTPNQQSDAQSAIPNLRCSEEFSIQLGLSQPSAATLAATDLSDQVSQQSHLGTYTAVAMGYLKLLPGRQHTKADVAAALGGSAALTGSPGITRVATVSQVQGHRCASCPASGGGPVWLCSLAHFSSERRSGEGTGILQPLEWLHDVVGAGH
ncbi:hypothetical protein P7K49_017406 [Saguinus oedipus]|uniref:Uncharacterized protein n=1 Tax=Saguinus oedipus TaxID=9490 RepID=A0ABQ9V2L7_SAGOE|nr:hypothetical protein P7K49_017406 [Saguinus oedipus]